jgi:hypothetical protein
MAALAVGVELSFEPNALVMRSDSQVLLGWGFAS